MERAGRSRRRRGDDVEPVVVVTVRLFADGRIDSDVKGGDLAQGLALLDAARVVLGGAIITATCKGAQAADRNRVHAVRFGPA